MRTSKNRNGRFYAIRSLGCIAPIEKILPPLIGSFKDSDSSLRRTILYSFIYDWSSDSGSAQLRPECAQLLTQVLADPQVDSLAVIDTLSEMGADAKAALPAIQPFLTDQNPNIHTAAMKAYERISATKASSKGFVR
jgi:HEAT repeat protein